MENKDLELTFSPLIVGTMRLGVWGAQLSTEALEHFIDACLDMGLRDFDHADIYGGYTTETEFGAVLRRRPDLRTRLQLTTKCGIKMLSDNRPEHRLKSYDATKAHILASAERSLQELNTDYLDLLLLHRPDFLLDPYEVAEAFQSLQEAGKVRHFGVSNFSPSQVAMLHSFTPLVNNQVEISLLHRNAYSDGTLDQCLQYGIIPTAWSPMGGGAIFKNTDDPNLKVIQEVMEKLGTKYEASFDQIVLAWLLKHPAGIVPVLGTSKLERVKTALAAVDISLSHEDWYELWQAATGAEVP